MGRTLTDASEAEVDDAISGYVLAIDLTARNIQNEAKNGLKNDKYTLAMARTSAPHSASSQFFINTTNNGFLNNAEAQDGWGYAVFGKVVEGQSVVDDLGSVKTGRKGFHDDVPVDDIQILKAEEVA